MDPARQLRSLQEEHLVTLKADRTRPPATVGTPAGQGILFGPAAGQPGGFTDRHQGFLLSGRFWMVFLALAFGIGLLRR